METKEGRELGDDWKNHEEKKKNEMEAKRNMSQRTDPGGMGEKKEEHLS